jgi:uncharacterized protein (DUF58 family)
MASEVDKYKVRINIELLARQVVEGFIIGLHKSPFHGFSAEFAEHRIYNPGESTKNIDWKVAARTEKLFTKRFEEETNLRCQVVIDASSSMYFPYEPNKKQDFPANKVDFSTIAAASLITLFKKQRDAFGLSIFDEKVNMHSQVKSSTAHYQLLLAHLDNLVEIGEKKVPTMLNRSSDITNALHQIADSIHKRSLVMIFSDMGNDDTNSDALFSALQHLKYNKHEVMVFHVTDKAKEQDFTYENRPYIFIDMETGEKIRLQANQVKDHYVAQMAKFKENLLAKCLQYRIDFVECDIAEGVKPILQQYLTKRNRMGV